MRAIIDLTGQRFNRLNVKDQARTKRTTANELLNRALREIDRLYTGQPRANYTKNPLVVAIKKYLKRTEDSIFIE